MGDDTRGYHSVQTPLNKRGYAGYYRLSGTGGSVDVGMRTHQDYKEHCETRETLKLGEWNYQHQSANFQWNYWIYHTEKWDLYCGTEAGDVLFLVPQSYCHPTENIWVAHLDEYVGYTTIKDLQHLVWIKLHPEETIALLLL